MPYDTRYLAHGPGGPGFYVVNLITGKPKNKRPYKTKKAARPYQNALYANEPK